MSIEELSDIFQEKISGLMGDLEYLRTYLDDLLILTRDSFRDHLDKLEVLPEKLLEAGLHLNTEKSIFVS